MSHCDSSTRVLRHAEATSEIARSHLADLTHHENELERHRLRYVSILGRFVNDLSEALSNESI